MAATNMGAWSLAERPDLYDPQRNNFDFIVTGIDNLLKPGASETDADPYIKNASDSIRMSLVSATIPFFQQDQITVQRGNTEIKFADRPKFNDLSLVVNDYIGADVKSILLSWQSKSANINAESVGRASEYKKVCWLLEYTPDWKLVRTWKIYGAWISGISEDAFNNEQGDKKTITVTLKYDRAVMELPE